MDDLKHREDLIEALEQCKFDDLQEAFLSDPGAARASLVELLDLARLDTDTLEAMADSHDLAV